MKIDPSVTQINVNSIGNSTAALNKAAQQSNQAASSLNQAPASKRPQAVRQLNEARKSAESIKRAAFNNRMQTIKATTAKISRQTRENSKEANVLMAKVISPPGSKLPPQQLGQFLDKYA
ncbi:MAG: hypothetical protein Kow0029_29030 [Candidatus Rifleibacteriota bacterium]